VNIGCSSGNVSCATSISGGWKVCTMLAGRDPVRDEFLGRAVGEEDVESANRSADDTGGVR
jgi:hypothetical protein